MPKCVCVCMYFITLLISSSKSIQISFVIEATTKMGKGDHCAVYGCNNDRRYPEKQQILSYVGILRFYSPLSKKDKLMWEKMINRKDFKVTMSTKVCSNHFSLGYHCKESCKTPTLYMKGYEEKPERVYMVPYTQL